MQQELFSPFLNNLEKLFKSKKDYDVIIKAGEDNDQKEIYAHSNILRCQSDYFDTAFSSNWAEKKDGKYIFKKPNVLPHIFEIIIRYFYCGQLDLNVKNGPDTLKLDINTGRIGRVTDASHALVCSNRWGPIFGNGHDLSMNCVGKWVSRGSSTYSYLGIPYDFANDDYEVFQNSDTNY
ncbi:uncharacterized protein OCT59_008693 [Rhizophagus irregularis]|uniref:uncharacterized protein n=1 Tax=Rhizophagus irregularis TaxID=588596 RepID=UPI00331AC302|nr:hypothetical protein OCT59_008693 [Rhizophagus irregularis]